MEIESAKWKIENERQNTLTAKVKENRGSRGDSCPSLEREVGVRKKIKK
jgi:hypothetical protein